MYGSNASRNAIRSLTLANGTILTRPEDIKAEAARHFRDFLQSEDPDFVETPPEFLSNLLDYRCSREHCLQLVAPVTEEEIKKALFSLPSGKASGPDGFSKEFYVAAWNIVGSDFVVAVQSFFQYGFMPKSVNATLLTLIPKNPDLSSPTMKDYRPVACCNMLYKVVSKILANCLKIILPDFIEPNQSAFVKGRLLLENVHLAAELVKDYHKDTLSPRSAIKFDISKSFDTVQWPFIVGIFRALGFPDLFINWIYVCISTAYFSVVVNGELEGFFASHRGVRQGCFLSPYIFVMVQNVLSRLLNKAAQTGRIGRHPRCDQVPVTHLSFADDILEFKEFERNNMMLILRPDAAGVLRDRDGQAYNEDGQRIAEHGYMIPEIAQGVDRHQLGVDLHHGVNRADGRQMTLGDYNCPGLFYENWRAIRPTAFERSDDLGLQPAFYTLVSQHPFHGLSHEQPMDHIERFEDLVSIMKAQVVSEDYLHRKLFSYSLAGEAASWLKELIPGSLTTWQETKMAFLNNFTRNYCSYSYQAPSPPTFVSKMESMPKQIQESQQRILEISPLGRIESNLTTTCHAVLKKSEDEFVAVVENDANFVVAEADLSTRSLSVDRHHLGVDRHSSGTEAELTFDEAESSELDTEESTPDSSVDRHSPSVDRHWTRTAPYALVFPPPPKKSEQEIREQHCRAEDVSLLTKDISAILVYQDPEKKPNKRQSMAISELVSAMIQCSIPEKLPDPESFVLDCSISTDITAGYVKELDYIEQVKLQASNHEDWSGDHLFSTRIQDEAQIGDKLLQIAEPHCRNSAEIRAAGSVSIDTTRVSVDTRLDQTDDCRPHHLSGDTKSRHNALVSIDTTTSVGRHPDELNQSCQSKLFFGLKSLLQVRELLSLHLSHSILLLNS
ncbi:Reverse transcriptase domain [Arabidopsis thaliana x Arabidopsis arenosa]|uniref:Reverse transcriptase domain n=1 Tax=Arabidopsis thaliana x Arabidopsis arenosa TaxID=1240361 RepID=A0A8T1Y890_9BRAS|nr:Reverse transcriptase domain [Arabidopsis thaliana x Arabidopsis arenosa]